MLWQHKIIDLQQRVLKIEMGSCISIHRCLELCSHCLCDDLISRALVII
jgi:hypothetical protein